MLQISANDKITLPAMGSWPQTVHVFEEDSIWAVNAALSAERPLLIRGEPGVGKSQLARAAAKALKRAFISDVVHAQSECRDLLCNFDAVARLGEAQALVACRHEKDVNTILDPLRFLSPGPLWWVLNWESAEKQSENCFNAELRPERPEGWKPEMGTVLLIDEIDKADVDLPNGLLETLGNGAFTVPYLNKPVRMASNAPSPLVVVTTNEERELPAAFLRRCMVLQLKLPEEETKLTEWLVARGEIHFGDKCSEKVRRKAAEQLWQDRSAAHRLNLSAPGQAEYLDILRALSKMEREEAKQVEVLEKIRRFALKKTS